MKFPPKGVYVYKVCSTNLIIVCLLLHSVVIITH